jgi:hypothetical protein
VGVTISVEVFPVTTKKKQKPEAAASRTHAVEIVYCTA